MLYNWIYQKIGLVKLLSEFNPDGEAIFFAIGAVLCCVVSYLFGSLNFAIIVSKKKYNDDIRNYGSGNAGMTNMHRVYGAKGALYTLAGDVGKQIASVFFSALLLGEPGAYLGGLFCILGHIAPVFYKFKG